MAVRYPGAMAEASRLKATMLGAVLVAAISSSTACQDPCVVLAERICNCEPTVADRRACTIDRITNQQGRVDVSDADKAVCSEKLDTCTCAALDQNNLDACGFAPEGDG